MRIIRISATQQTAIEINATAIPTGMENSCKYTLVRGITLWNTKIGNLCNTKIVIVLAPQYARILNGWINIESIMIPRILSNADK